MKKQVYRNISGVPEGWVVVRIGTPSEDEFYINVFGRPQKAHRSFYGGGICVVTKISSVRDYKARRARIDRDKGLQDIAPAYDRVSDR